MNHKLIEKTRKRKLVTNSNTRSTGTNPVVTAGMEITAVTVLVLPILLQARQSATSVVAGL